MGFEVDFPHLRSDMRDRSTVLHCLFQCTGFYLQLRSLTRRSAFFLLIDTPGCAQQSDWNAFR